MHTDFSNGKPPNGLNEHIKLPPPSPLARRTKEKGLS